MFQSQMRAEGPETTTTRGETEAVEYRSSARTRLASPDFSRFTMFAGSSHMQHGEIADERLRSYGVGGQTYSGESPGGSRSRSLRRSGGGKSRWNERLTRAAKELLAQRQIGASVSGVQR